MRNKKVRALRKRGMNEIPPKVLQMKAFYPSDTLEGLSITFSENARNPVRNFDRWFRKLNRKMTMEELNG